MDFAQRLRELMDHYDLTAQDLARRLDLQKSAVSHLLSGRNKPRFDILARFARAFPDLNMRWLLTGEGRMLRSPTPTVQGIPLVDEARAREMMTSAREGAGEKPTAQISSVAIEKAGNVAALKNPSASPADTPDEIMRIYPDGTFDILRRRKAL